MADRKVTVPVEEHTLTNALQLTAIVELLEERGILTLGRSLVRWRRQSWKAP